MKNIFGPWLANLWKPLGLLLKAIPDYQFYMRHPQHKKKVAKEFLVQYPQGPVGDNALKEQNRIAMELLRGETVEVQEALKKEAME